MSDTQLAIVLITAPAKEIARTIAQTLVEQKLAACVNIISPVQSIYRWKEEIVDDQEVLMIIKTRAELVNEQLIPAVKAIHPYQVPEIIALPIFAGSNDYLGWIEQETTSANET